MLKSIKSNSKIGVISPAWVPLDDRMKSGFQYLESKGYQIKKGKNLGRVYKYFAGTDEERLADGRTQYKGGGRCTPDGRERSPLPAGH